MTDPGPFCDFGGLPRSQCAHCRTRRAVIPFRGEHRVPESGITAEQAARYAAARYGSLLDAERLQRSTPEHFSLSWFAWMWEKHLAALEHGITVQARWPGRCRGCGDEWDEGDVIWWSEGESAWVCGGCFRQG